MENRQRSRTGHMARPFILLLIPAVVILLSDLIEASPLVRKTRESLDKSHAAAAAAVVNVTVDPCDNFCAFTCALRQPIDLKRNQIFAEATELFSETFIEIDKSGNEPEFQIGIDNLFRGCVEDGTVKPLDLRSLREVLKLLGGWPVVEGVSWSAKNTSWRELQIKLSKIGFDGFIQTYYSIEEDAMVLAPISDLFLRRLNDSSRNSFQRQIVKTAIAMGADPKLAETEIQRAMNLESDWLIRVAYYDNADELGNQENLKMLTDIFNTSTKEVMHLFPLHFDLSRNRLKIPEKKLLELEIALDNAAIMDVFNYAFMRLVAKLTLLSVNAVTRIEQCMDFISTRFPEAQEILFVRKHLPKNIKKSTEELISLVKKRVRREAAELERKYWQLEKRVTVDLSGIDSIFFSLGYPDEFFDNQLIDDYYKNLKIHSNNFFYGFYNYTLFKLENHTVPAFDFREKLKAYVSADSNILSDRYISALQLYTYSHTDTPKYIVYGELVSLFGKIISKSLSIKHRTDFFLPEEYQMIGSMKERITDWETEIGYSLYQDWLDVHGPEAKPSGLENYTDEQIFWMYRSKLECHRKNHCGEWWEINCGLRQAFKCGIFH